MDDNLFADLPFNLAGESQSSELTAEGEARVRSLAESEARKAQRALFGPAPDAYPNHRRCLSCETLVYKRNVSKHDCTRRFDRPYVGGPCPKSSTLRLR